MDHGTVYVFTRSISPDELWIMEQFMCTTSSWLCVGFSSNGEWILITPFPVLCCNLMTFLHSFAIPPTRKTSEVFPKFCQYMINCIISLATICLVFTIWNKMSTLQDVLVNDFLIASTACKIISTFSTYHCNLRFY